MATFVVTAGRPAGRYCQARLHKRVGNADWYSVRWISESLARSGSPISFKQDGDGRWSHGWTCRDPIYPVERIRAHASWDDRRLTTPEEIKGS